MRNRSSKSESLFLIEMIVVVFFFAVCAAVCARLFVQSHRMKNESLTLTRAVMDAQNAAELFYATGGDLERVQDALPDNTVLITVQDGNFLDGILSVYEDNKLIYELPLHLYLPLAGQEPQAEAQETSAAADGVTTTATNEVTP